MAQKQESNGLLDTINTANNLLGVKRKFDTLSGLFTPAAQPTGFGATPAGIMDTAAPAGGFSAMLPMLPFAALAGFIAPKLIQGMFGAKPKITFSGLEPKYRYHSDGLMQYSGPDQDRLLSKTKPVTSKKGYHYNLDVEETGKDRDVAEALVKHFDSMFDEMAAQGIPVNDLLDRNKDFYFGGRVDKGMSPEQLVQDVLTHMAPDVEAYQSGSEPPPREITIRPTGARSDGMAGRDAYDAGLDRPSYNVTVGQDGAQLNSKEIVLSPHDPRAGFVKAQTGVARYDKGNPLPDGVSLTPGFTYKIDTSSMAGKDAFDMGLNANNTVYTVPNEPGQTIPPENDRAIPGGDLGNDGGPDVREALAQQGFATEQIDEVGVALQTEGFVNTQEGDNMTDNEKIVRDQYKELNGREAPDQAGIDFWVAKMDAGELTEETLGAAMQEAAGDWENTEGETQWVNEETGDRVWDEARDPVTEGGDVDSDLGADDAQTYEEQLVRGIYAAELGRDNPDAEGVKYWTDMLEGGMSEDELRRQMVAEGDKWTDQGDGNYLRDDGLQAKDDMPTDYEYDIDNPQIFTDFVNAHYDTALDEYQKQSEQFQGATDQYKADSDAALGDQQRMLEDLETRLDTERNQYEDTQGQNIDDLDRTQQGLLTDYTNRQEGYLTDLDNRQNELFDTAKSEQDEYLNRLLQAIDDTNSDNLPRVTRLAGGQEVSYIPRSLRAANNDDRTAELNLFDRSKATSDTFLGTGTDQAQFLYGGQSNFANNLLGTGTNQAQTLYGAQSDTANNLLNTGTQNANNLWDAGNMNVQTQLQEGKANYGNNMVMADQGNATLNYLDALKELVNMEQDRDRIEAQRIAAEKGLEYNYDALASQEEAAEPGVLDYLIGGGTLLTGLGNLGKGTANGGLDWLNPTGWF